MHDSNVTCNAVCAGKGKAKLFERRQTARPPSRDITQPTAPTTGSPSMKPPEVDEEGYSIRPADASEIRFDDAEQKQWSTDSDSDDEGVSRSCMVITWLFYYFALFLDKCHMTITWMSHDNHMDVT